MSISGLICSVQLVIDLDVKITFVLCIWLVCQISCHTLTFLHCKYFAKIENSLLPVRIFGMWAGRESNRFVTGGKINVEPGDEGVNEIISLATETVGSGKGEFSSCDRVEIDCEYRTWISDKGFHLDCVDQWLGQSVVFHRREVEAIDVVPD